MKNWIIISLYLLAQIPTHFFGTTATRNLALTDYFIKYEMTLDWVVYFYVNYLSFLLLAYCVHYNKGINKSVTRFILIVSILDMIHLMIGAMQGYGMAKIGIAIVLIGIYEWRAVLRTIKNIYK